MNTKLNTNDAFFSFTAVNMVRKTIHTQSYISFFKQTKLTIKM